MKQHQYYYLYILGKNWRKMRWDEKMSDVFYCKAVLLQLLRLTFPNNMIISKYRGPLNLYWKKTNVGLAVNLHRPCKVLRKILSASQYPYNIKWDILRTISMNNIGVWMMVLSRYINVIISRHNDICIVSKNRPFS